MKSALESGIISLLRFPLMVFVVLIHSDIKEAIDYRDVSKEIISVDEIYYKYSFLRYFFCDVIARTAVPLFFFISGYLFFRWTNVFSFEIYKNKIKSRLWSIFLPYILWNTLYIIAFFILSRVSQDDAFDIYRNNDILAIIIKAWTNPPCFPFWFIRDLFVLCLFTPVIYPILKNTNWMVPIFILILWLTCFMPQLLGMDVQGWTFFVLGAYCGVHKYNLPKKLYVYSTTMVNILGIIYILLGMTEALYRNEEWIKYLHHFNILLGIYVIVIFAAHWVNLNRTQIPIAITASGFFLYGYHGLFVKMLRNLLLPIIRPSSDFAFIGTFFIDFIVTIVVGVTLYRLMSKYLPKTISIFCGRR